MQKKLRRAGCLLIAGLLISSPALAASSCLIAIDAGHTYQKPGATSARGVPEMQFNMALAKKFQASLKKAHIRSFLTNPNGRIEHLVYRPWNAAKAGATLFISIHHDSTEPQLQSTWQWQGEDQKYCDRFCGYGLFVSAENPHFDESLRTAQMAGDKLLAEGLVPALYHADPVLGENRPLLDNAAILVEAGVIVNRDEELKVSTPAYQNKIVAALTAAAVDHCSRLKH